MPLRKSTSRRSFGHKKRGRKLQLHSARKRKYDHDSSVDTSVRDATNETMEIELQPSDHSDDTESALQRKFRLFEEHLDVSDQPTDNTGKATFVLFDSSLLCNLVTSLGCPNCNTFGHLNMVVCDEYDGCATEVNVFCSFCSSTVVTTQTSKRCSKSGERRTKTAFEVNRRSSLAAVYSGYGYSGMEKFSMVMGMPVLHQRSFVRNYTAISAAVQHTLNDILCNSGQCVRKAYAEIGVFPDDDNILDIAVSYDGSWMKRGHVSNFGVGVAIDLLTGLVLDFEVLSKYCHNCALKKKKLKSAEFKQWFRKHKNSCDKTFEGTSGAMEAAAAIIIWKRSVEKHKFRYVEILSDGDAKTFQALTEENIYGPEHIIVKEECVNHVGKRMFTALGKLLVESRAKGESLGGRGEGKLTRSIQEKLSNYYRNAIRSNSGDIESMRNAVFATLFHTISTDSEPHHNRCPKGQDSWCFFNKALALGKPPGKHKENMTTQLHKDIAEKLIPIYQRLGDEQLLRRCLKGKTQNSNESLHSVIWSKCPKTSFLHMNRVTMGVGLAIIDFNYGRRGLQSVLQNLGIEPGLQTSTSLISSDTRRREKSKERATLKSRHVREAKRRAKMQLESRFEQEEGEPSYASGGFL